VGRALPRRRRPMQLELQERGCRPSCREDVVGCEQFCQSALGTFLSCIINRRVEERRLHWRHVQNLLPLSLGPGPGRQSTHKREAQRSHCGWTAGGLNTTGAWEQTQQR